MKRIHIFKSGRHTDTRGRAWDFSEAVLQQIASTYDPQVHEAPLVVGHPREDAPAYGYVQSVTSTAEGLFATPHQVPAEFAEVVRTGAYKHVSASFYAPEHPSNPTPGSWHLRHVGFLGAHPPAVKGLKPIEFAEGDDHVVEFAEIGYGLSAMARIVRRLREWVIGDKGLEAADSVIPSWEVEELERVAQEQVTADVQSEAAPAYAEFAERESALAAREQELQERLATIEAQAQAARAVEAERERQARLAGYAEFAERLASPAERCRILPADVPVVSAILAAVGGDSVDVVSFSEGNEQPSADAVRAFLSRLPGQVDFSERAAGRGSEEAISVLEDPRALARAAAEFVETERAAGRRIGASEAVTIVKKRLQAA